jgi:hypothetical protein
VLLSVSAIAVKVVTHNPHADNAHDASRSMGKVGKRANKLIDGARKPLVEHGRAWNALRSEILSVEGEAVGLIEAECARILDERGRRGEKGPLQLPITVLDHSGEAGRTVEQPVLPALRVDILQDAREVADRHHPKTLRGAFAVAVAALNRQFRAGDPDATTEHGQIPAPRPPVDARHEV